MPSNDDLFNTLDEIQNESDFDDIIKFILTENGIDINNQPDENLYTRFKKHLNDKKGKCAARSKSI